MFGVPSPRTALGIALWLAFNLWATAHAVLRKRDVRAALGWTGLIWALPFGGAALYALLGINRISRKAKRLLGPVNGHPVDASALTWCLPDRAVHEGADVASDSTGAACIPAALQPLVTLGDRVVKLPLVAGQTLQVLDGGRAAYDAMLEAIEGARSSVSLCSYIFDRDSLGLRFADALGRARRRGVEVRVMVDGVGARYSRPTIQGALEEVDVRCALFLPPWPPLAWPFFNLRNHRKVMVVDGRVAFTGGMNLRAGFAGPPGEAASDVHFRVEGPVVAQLQQCFAHDWWFVARETLQGELWFPQLQPSGEHCCRAVVDGPDEDFETLRYLLLGALTQARRRVVVVTPYFVPDLGLMTALRVAAYRGVEVDVVLPERSNLPWVDWAARAQLWQALEAGVRVWFSPPPFDHAKLMVVDDQWSLVGSANWDARSLRLNFELNLEVIGQPFAREVGALVQRRLAVSRRLTLEQVQRQPWWIQLRGGLARLLSPYL